MLPSSYINRQAVALALPFMLFWVAPLTFYFGNVNEISFSLSDIVWPMSGIFVGSAVSIFIILTGLAKLPRLYQGFSGVLVGASVAVWVQSQLFVWNFGPLDGRDIDWSRWSTHMWVEGIAWVGIILVSIYLFTRQNKTVSRLMVRLVFALGVISVASTYIISPHQAVTKANNQKERLDAAFKFHSEKNVIVILLDTFQSDYFSLIMNDYPEEVEFLDGFKFYKDTISLYPTTAPNMPAIFTGKIYHNRQKFNEFMKEAYSTFDLREHYENEGFSSEAFSFRTVVPGASSLKVVIKHFSNIVSWRNFLDYGLFRAVPSFKKAAIYNDGDWLVSFWGRSDYPPERHGSDIRFMELFENKASVSQNLNGGAFRFYHFHIPHFPLRVDEDLKYNPDLKGRDGYTRQARGALKLAQRVVNKLKKLGIYDSSEIVIMADHGTLLIPPISTTNSRNATLSDIPNSVRSSALALFLHKKPYSKGKLIVDNSPLMHSDLSCVLGIENQYLNCKGFRAAIQGIERKRTYLFYNWKHGDWKRDFMPSMTEYVINGPATNFKSWRVGEYRYEPEKTLLLTPYKYKVGQPIKFSAEGSSDDFILFGWSIQEPTHRWTDGSSAGLRFVLDKEPSGDLILHLLGSGYYAHGNIEHQMITVLVNGIRVANWELGNQWLAGTYEAVIPESIISGGSIEVKFEISNPASPSDSNLSGDSRKLGMAVNELVIETYKPSRWHQNQQMVPAFFARPYTVGESIYFGKQGSASDFVADGWSGQEPTHRWTNGSRARLHFKLDQAFNSDLVLRLRGNGYLAQGEIDHQRINVIINNQQVGEWVMRGEEWFEAPIPAELIGNGFIEVVFEISDPTAPCEVHKSNDCRKLGISVKELVIQPVFLFQKLGNR